MKAKSVVVEQARTKRYTIELMGDISEFGISLKGRLCKPKEYGPSATLDNLNERVREHSFQYVENTPLTYESGERTLQVSGDQMHSCVMSILTDAINSIESKGEDLFEFVIMTDKKKLREKKSKLDEDINKMKERIKQTQEYSLKLEKQLEIEKEKAKIREEMLGTTQVPQQTKKQVGGTQKSTTVNKKPNKSNDVVTDGSQQTNIYNMLGI